MFHTEDIGSRWSIMSVSHKTLDDACREAERSSKANWCRTLVWDNTNGPVGVLVAAYDRGQKGSL